MKKRWKYIDKKFSEKCDETRAKLNTVYRLTVYIYIYIYIDR